MSTNVKRATRKGLLPDYDSILAIIFNIIHVFFSKTFFVLFCFPSNMAAKYAVRHVSRHVFVMCHVMCSCSSCVRHVFGRHAKVVYTCFHHSLLHILNTPNIRHLFTSLKSRIALQVARKIAPCDWAFRNSAMQKC